MKFNFCVLTYMCIKRERIFSKKYVLLQFLTAEIIFDWRVYIY